MGELATQASRKVLAVGVLSVAAYVLFKIVLAVIGVVWALRAL